MALPQWFYNVLEGCYCDRVNVLSANGTMGMSSSKRVFQEQAAVGTLEHQEHTADATTLVEPLSSPPSAHPQRPLPQNFERHTIILESVPAQAAFSWQDHTV